MTLDLSRALDRALGKCALPNRPIFDQGEALAKVHPNPLNDPRVDDDARKLISALYLEYAKHVGLDFGGAAEAIELVEWQHRHGLIEIIAGDENFHIRRTRFGEEVIESYIAAAKVVSACGPIERAQGSRFGGLGKFLQSRAESEESRAARDLVQKCDGAVFVLEHDWAAAIGVAEFQEAPEVRLPYPNCAFEFRVAGRTICVLASDAGLAVFIESKWGWTACNPGLMQFAPVIVEGAASDDEADTKIGLHLERFQRMVNDQINGVLIALDANIAETQRVDPPEKLNRARERRGKEPLPSYRVVRLAHGGRRTSAEAAGGDGERRRVRLHFRRGHWRHLESSRIWINWMLVGDPDLGFIDKHYRI